jgi:hypothetical protein
VVEIELIEEHSIVSVGRLHVVLEFKELRDAEDLHFLEDTSFHFRDGEAFPFRVPVHCRRMPAVRSFFILP